MNCPTFLRLAAVLSFVAIVPNAKAVQLAFTDFDDSTLVVDEASTKTNLNWVLDGLEDPGNMSVIEFEGGPVNFFNNNTFVQDIFIPGINVGNGNTSWVTEVPITVAAGSTVTLTDVTFNSVSVSGGQAENVNRRNDYALTLISPSAVEIETVEIADVLAGNVAGQPLVTADFADVLLSEAGTYTLSIRGGDFLPNNETGNHTGFDNLSINGTLGGGSTGLLGDYNDDDTVNLADYTIWRNNLGEADTVLPPGSTDDNSGFVDEAEYTIWRGNFGASASLSASVAAVPEPSTIVLVALTLGLPLLRRKMA